MTTSSTSPSPAAPAPRTGWVAQLAEVGLVALAGVVSGLVGAYSVFLEQPLTARVATPGPTVRPTWFLWEGLAH